MAVIDLVQWRPQGGEPLFAWKFPESNLSTFTQLIVHESQEAVLFSKGQLMGKFGPGKHTLNTENLPVLRSFYGLPFGRKNPFTAEVWFVNKLMPLNIEWRTDAMMHHDPDYQTMVPLTASGRYGLKVEDAERFLLQLVGTAQEFTARQLTDHFYGELVTKTKTAILQFMLAHRVGIKTISACLAPLSDALRGVMAPFWDQFGFSVAGFYVTTIEVDGQTEPGRRILDAMSRQSAQLIVGASYQQDRALEIAEQAARSGGSGLLAAVMMGNMFGGTGSVLSSGAPPMLPGTNTPVASGAAAAQSLLRTVYCSNCSRKFTSDMRFCPHCGDQYTPCPRCGADNDQRAARCVSCGSAMGTAVAAIGESCDRCQNPLSPTQTFCPRCGLKVDRS